MHNSNWRKILIILMIINLLLTLCSKVFGAFPNNQITIPSIGTFTLNDTYNNYKWVIFAGVVNGSSLVRIVLSDDEFTVTRTSDGYRINGTHNIGSKSTNQYGTQNYNWFNNAINTNIPTTLTSQSNATLVGGIYSQATVFSNFEVKNSSGTVVINNTNPSFVNPFFSSPSDEVANLKFNNLYIELGDYSPSENLYIHNLQINQIVSDDVNDYYYYSDQVIELNNKTKYYTRFLDSDKYYYSVPKYVFDFELDTKYILFISSNPEIITNSIGIIDLNYSDDIYDLININTTGNITSGDITNDKIQNIDDTLNNNTVSPDTESDIDDSLDFNNSNENLNNLNNGFFSRLTSMLSNLLGYSLSEDTSVIIPLPNSNKSIILHSSDIYNNVTGAIRIIINAFWLYIFSFYMWKFINKLYIAISTGNILDTFSSNDEAITNNML